jgi:hypothetical protein
MTLLGGAAAAAAVALFIGVAAAANGQPPANEPAPAVAACEEHMASMTAMHEMMGGPGMMGPGMMGPGMMGPGASPDLDAMVPGHERHHDGSPPGAEAGR